AMYGAGVAFADLDMDGDPDVVLLGNGHRTVGIFENDGIGRYTDRSLLSPIGPLPGATGIAAADYDGDGDLDLYISVHDGANALLRNEGGFVFRDMAAGAGVNDGGKAQGAAWGDYDRDGWLDLYVANHDQLEGANLLYRNQGDGTFVDIAAALGVEMTKHGATFHATFFDYNHDRLPDIYLCSDRGEFCTLATNHLFKNQGTTFVEVTEETGTEACVGCMGTAVGDFDANGFTDLYCTNLPFGNVLMLNEGDATFTEQALPAGVAAYLLSWGTLFFDYDNDSFLDLYVCGLGPNRLFENKLSWPCPDVAIEMGVDTDVYSKCFAVADIDGDGDVDMLVEGDNVPVQLFLNNEGTRRNWLQVKVFGSSANTQAIGARVDIRTGERHQFCEVQAGVGFKSSSSLVISFGLAEATVVDELTVEWPLGGTTTLNNVLINRRVTIHEGLPPVSPRSPQGQ
ncbi:MAG: hypothetical protein ACI8QZ_003793, partial [Chlamydiales bacterium]